MTEKATNDNIYLYFCSRVHFTARLFVRQNVMFIMMVFHMLLEDETGYVDAEGVKGNLYEKIRVSFQRCQISMLLYAFNQRFNSILI